MLRILINEETTIYCKKGDNLFWVLCSHGYLFPGNCGGTGRCRACSVFIKNTGKTVKSCQYTVSEDMEIHIDSSLNANAASILTDYQIHKPDAAKGTGYGFAIDLGTTTIAAELVNLADGKTMDTKSTINSQTVYGADVISRIRTGASPEGLCKLRAMVRKDFASLFLDLLSLHPEIGGRIEACTIAGNTAMTAIAAGLTTENLGSYPFTIKNPDTIRICFSDFFAGDSEMLKKQELFMENLLLLPNISAFIGSDIAAGAAALHLNRDENYRLLIDLGTNGELFLCNKDRGFAASTACGPAFEGCFRSRRIHGSNVFDMLALLRKRKLCNAEGVLADPYFASGISMGPDIRIDMELIRSFQLAKSAICSGILMLLKQAGLSEADVTEVYVSGAFGFHLNIANAVCLGLIPESFKSKVTISGNTALAGAHLALTVPDFLEAIQKLKQMTTTIQLGDTEGYEELFIRNLNFPEKR